MGDTRPGLSDFVSRCHPSSHPSVWNIPVASLVHKPERSLDRSTGEADEEPHRHDPQQRCDEYADEKQHSCHDVRKPGERAHRVEEVREHECINTSMSAASAPIRSNAPNENWPTGERSGAARICFGGAGTLRPQPPGFAILSPVPVLGPSCAMASTMIATTVPASRTLFKLEVQHCGSVVLWGVSGFGLVLLGWGVFGVGC